MIKFFRKIRQRLLIENKFSKYLLYAIGEIVLVMIGILMALQVNNWKDTTNNKVSEQKILSEIRNGIWRDLNDFESNVYGNKEAILASDLLRNFIHKKETNQDSLSELYNYLFNNFDPVINKSGYESLKSSGLKTIKNDSLRVQIVELYDYYYTIIENNTSRQSRDLSYSNYGRLISKLYPYIEFDDKGKLISTSTPMLSDIERKELLKYLDLIVHSREGIVRRYQKVISRMKSLSVNIDKELGHFIPAEQLQEYVGTYEYKMQETEERAAATMTMEISVEENYLMTIPSWRNWNKSFYMTVPDEFVSLELLVEGNKVPLSFIRDENQNIIGLNDNHPRGNHKFIKID
ncbi:DUF6090 family protein [Neolewinella persica]|uniref:DUF6090 family protein n=1 Tax=Neolewinella persica TaxID=70998 RepID=UPI00036E11A8|nr:DUF6090 family protein [Neolewinella persica]